jgi:anti-anti-sigma factor
MTSTSTNSGSNRAVGYGNPTFDCDGAKIRAQCRHLATVVTIGGEIDEMNAARIAQYTSRFVLAEKPLVLDLSGVSTFSTQSVSLLQAVDEGCRTAGVEWSLIASQSVVRVLRTVDDRSSFPTADSVAEALHHFAEVIVARRHLLSVLARTA